MGGGGGRGVENGEDDRHVVGPGRGGQTACGTREVRIDSLWGQGVGER